MGHPIVAILYIHIYMYISSSQKRIIGAILLGTTIISTALIIKGEPETLAEVTVVNGEAIVVTAAPDRNPIPIADSNGDGVPDWQEALQVTDALEIRDTTTTFIPPETLTDQFALEFFEQMVRNQNYGEFGKSPEELVATFSTSLANEAVDEVIGLDRIVTSGDNSPEALAAYGEAVARVILAHDDPSNENEAVILERALRDNNPDELAKLDGKIAVYSSLLKETLVIPAPNSVSREHLILVNAYQAILTDLYAMRDAFADPMLALLRMKRYQEDATTLATAITAIATKLVAGGATWPPSSPVFQIISISE